MINESKHPMTLEQCKDHVAKKYNFSEWLEAVRKFFEHSYTVNESVLLSMENEAAELYASTQLESLIQENEKLREINKELVQFLEDIAFKTPEVHALISKAKEHGK